MRVATVNSSLQLTGEAALPRSEFQSSGTGPSVFCRVWRPHLYFDFPFSSMPADALEERRDLGCCAIGIFTMREVTHAFKHREIEI